MFILKKGHQPGVYVPFRALFLVLGTSLRDMGKQFSLRWKAASGAKLFACRNFIIKWNTMKIHFRFP